MKYKVDIYCDGIKLRTSPPHLSNITVAIRDCPFWSVQIGRVVPTQAKPKIITAGREEAAKHEIKQSCTISSPAPLPLPLPSGEGYCRELDVVSVMEFSFENIFEVFPYFPLASRRKIFSKQSPLYPAWSACEWSLHEQWSTQECWCPVLPGTLPPCGHDRHGGHRRRGAMKVYVCTKMGHVFCVGGQYSMVWAWYIVVEGGAGQA